MTATVPPRPATVPDDAPFRPAWWLGNPHLSTVWGKFFRTPPALPVRIERWATPDGDAVHLARTDAAPGAPTFLLLHGLEGSVRSHYLLGTLQEAARRGWQANALLFRSCHGELNAATRSYHSGETGDLDHVVRRLLDERPDAPLVLAGVSLGGNVLLKWLGEQGSAVRGHVVAATAVSTPFDLARSCAHIDAGPARVYARNFLRSLRAKALRKIAQHPGLADADAVRDARTLWAFDDAYTAVVHGFADAADYYARSSSLPFLPAIRVPTLLLSARDDPFHPPSVLDDVAAVARHNPALTLEFPARGGHVGFVEGPHPWAARAYAERRVVAFGAARLAERD